jgi:PLD-like domain/Secretion system C-terminal sorting domain
MATASNSSGEIRIWFNNPVDNSVSTGTNAVYNSNFVDTIIHFIDNAFYSIDMALYNIDNVNNIVTALNDAYQRGVAVRVICDAEVNADAYSTLSIGASNKKLAPTGTTPDGGYYGIQHNKFIVIDAVSTDPMDTWVISGSTNFTDDQLKIDKQNMIAIQDQSLAKAYRAEFEEMFSGVFGPEKTNNTPHEFVIDGKRVELYFSPSDDTENRILSVVESAQQDLYFAVFSYTRYGISYEIEDAIERGVFAAGIWDQTDALDPTAIEVLEGAMESTLFESAGSALMHHKYLIVDAHCPQSDPMVLTGSHNWTSSANSRNDENTLIIHDSTIANIYYQEFSARYNEEGGTIVVEGYCDYVSIDASSTASSIKLYPNPANELLIIETAASVSSVNIQIIDLTGRILIDQFSSGKIHQVDVSNINDGMYLVNVNSMEEKGVSRLVISR